MLPSALFLLVRMLDPAVCAWVDVMVNQPSRSPIPIFEMKFMQQNSMGWRAKKVTFVRYDMGVTKCYTPQWGKKCVNPLSLF